MMLKNFPETNIILMLIVGLCSADSEAVVVYGTNGSSIIFICPYKDSKVRWIFIYDENITFTISQGASISNTQTFGSRVSIVGNNTAGEYNLQLSGLQESDQGLFSCSVGVQMKQYKLELLAAPSLPKLQDVTADNKIPGTEGQSLTLRCITTGGKPPPLVNITVANVSNSSNQAVECTIANLERRYDRQLVRCEANSSALSSPLVTNATLYLKLKPLQPTFSPDSVSTEETRPLEVSCTSTGSRPAATFQWTIGPANVTYNFTREVTHNTTDDTYTVTSTLTYTVNRIYDGHKLTCGAYNEIFTSRVSTSTTVIVKFAPDVTVTNITYKQDSDSRLVTCLPVGNPTTYTYYRWQHKSTYGELIRELVGGLNGVLTLPSVPVEARYQDTGEYICTASNGIKGRDGKIQQTGSGYVTVNAQPTFTNGNKDTEYSEIGSNVTIHVFVYSVPKYTSLSWYKNNIEILQTDKYALSVLKAMVFDTFHSTMLELDGYQVTLTIKNLVESDFNVSYRVELSNGVGQTVNYTTLLKSSSRPQTPENFTILSAAEFSILVQWEPGYNGGYEQTFYIEYSVNGSNMWTSEKILNTKQSGRQIYTLSGLQDDTMYELRMYAENKYYKSLPTEIVSIKTIKADIQAQKQIGPIVGGVGGALAAILIIIVVIWFMIFKRKKDTSTQSKASRSESDVPDGLHHNILYQSAGSDFKPLVPKVESGKKDKKPSTSETEYAEVQKPNAVYAAVDKTVQQKNVQDKKQKDKKKKPKKPGKKDDKAGNNNKDGEYSNAGMSLKDMGEGDYANSEDRNVPPTSHKNQLGLEYADLSFTKPTPQKGKKPVIHGAEDRTLYSEVDHSKKAPPPPQESAYEETNFKHG